MADGFPILSAGTCSCAVTCGGPVPPKYFRAIYRWDRSNLRPSIGHGDYRAGRGLSTNLTTHQSLVECTGTVIVSGTNGRWDGTYCYQVKCVDFIQATYNTVTWTNPGLYLRATNTAIAATLDFNIGLWKTNNPTGTTTNVNLNTGTWYDSWTTGNIAEFVNVSNCATFDAKSNSFFNNPCNSTSSYIGCCAYCDLEACSNCNPMFPGASTFGLVCSCYANDDDCCYTFGPGGVTARTVTWYGGPKSQAFTYHNIYGNALGTNITLELATYDRDPNTTGAQKLYYIDPVRINAQTAYEATRYGDYNFSVSAIDGNFTPA